jgi:hypothetical protein
VTRFARRSLASLLVLCVALAGCETHWTRLDTIEGAKYDESRPQAVKSEACGVMLLFPIIPIRTRSRQLRAELAIQGQAGDAVITDVHVQERWMWLLFATLLCTEISGTAYPKVH